MKKKITLLALMLVLVVALVATFVVSVSAEEEQIVVTYNEFSGSVWKTATPNADGSYTMLTTKKSGNGTATLADGTVVDKVFYGWFTKDGTLYAPGETVTFTKSTQLYEAYGVTVNTAEDLDAVSGTEKVTMFVKLGANVTSSVPIKASWATTIVDLNGHNLTVTNNDYAFYGYRGACVIIGKGKVIHTPEKLRTDDKAGFFYHELHTFGYDSNPQLCWVGKDVEIETPYNLVYVKAETNSPNVPNIDIYGTVSAKSIVRGAIFNNANCNIYESAKLTLSGDNIFNFTNTSGTEMYMNLSLAGEITLTSANAVLLSDFLMTTKFAISTITNGSFTVSSTDAERIAMFLPDTLMLKPTENADGTTTYNVTEADCIHDWVLDTEASVAATPGATGLDVFKCSKCKTGKQSITVYSPETAEIKVVVRTEEGDKEYKVLAGDVLDFQFNGVGAAALCYIAGLKDTADFTADMIVSAEIPAGVAELTGFDNSTLETVSILDGATVKVYTLDKLTGLKTINVGKANVTFEGLVKSTVEKISSKVEGATLTFSNNCFYKGASIKSLEMCAGSTYKFGTNSFRECGLTELIFPDNSTISWGNTAFAECQKLEYIYIGSNIGVKTINDKAAVFDGISNLKKVVIMDLTKLGQYSFSTKAPGAIYGPLCDLTVYCHSADVTIHSEAFNTRNGNYHVYLYTVDADITGNYSKCNSVIYNGIGHAYTLETITESTCVTNGTAGYITDCPCGIDYRANAYTTYSSYDNSLNNVAHEPFGTDIVDLPLSEEHTLSEIVKSVEYKDGFLSLGTTTFKCLYCDEAVSTEEEASYPAIFTFLGYSVPENGELSISVGYSINKSALKQYEATAGKLEFGVVGAVAERLDGNDPLNVANMPVIKASMDGGYSSFDFVIKGFDETYLELAMIMCAYVYDGTKYVYLQETQVDTPEAVSINSILASK